MFLLLGSASSWSLPQSGFEMDEEELLLQLRPPGHKRLISHSEMVRSQAICLDRIGCLLFY
jgi:hypothetical protein